MIEMYFKIRPRKACNYPNLRSFGWVSYDKVGVSYSGKLGNKSEARASDLRSYPGLWWNRIKQHYYNRKEKKVSTLRGPAQLADLQGELCAPPITLHYQVLKRTIRSAVLPYPCGALVYRYYDSTVFSFSFCE